MLARAGEVVRRCFSPSPSIFGTAKAAPALLANSPAPAFHSTFCYLLDIPTRFPHLFISHGVWRPALCGCSVEAPVTRPSSGLP